MNKKKSEEPPTESPEAASTDFDVDEDSMEDEDFLPADSPEPSFSDLEPDAWAHQGDYMKDQDFLPADSPEPSFSDFEHWHDAWLTEHTPSSDPASTLKSFLKLVVSLCAAASSTKCCYMHACSAVTPHRDKSSGCSVHHLRANM